MVRYDVAKVAKNFHSFAIFERPRTSSLSPS